MQEIITFDGSCPDCGCTIWRPGPAGGLAQNIECVRCFARLNVAFWHGQFVMGHRIASEKDGGGEWREDMFPRKVLQ